jgi:hypothetical protein
VTAAVTGLGYSFAGTSPPEVDIGWGYALAPVAVIALAVRIRRGSVPPLLWVGLGIVLAYWVLGALAYSSVRPPGLNRYIYLGAVGVLVVAAAGLSTTRFSKVGVAAVYVLAAASIATNLAFTRDATRFVRDGYSGPARAQLAMLELARERVDPAFDPVLAVRGAAPVSAPAGPYLDAVDRYGSPAFTDAELEAAPEGAREVADQVLAGALELKLLPTAAPVPEAGCAVIDQREHDLQPGVFALTAGEERDATVALGRFATLPTATIGTLERGESAFLEVPADASPELWRAGVAGGGTVEICPVR